MNSTARIKRLIKQTKRRNKYTEASVIAHIKRIITPIINHYNKYVEPGHRLMAYEITHVADGGVSELWFEILYIPENISYELISEICETIHNNNLSNMTFLPHFKTANNEPVNDIFYDTYFSLLGITEPPEDE
jgi:hypothetical protein